MQAQFTLCWLTTMPANKLTALAQGCIYISFCDRLRVAILNIIPITDPTVYISIDDRYNINALADLYDRLMSKIERTPNRVLMNPTKEQRETAKVNSANLAKANSRNGDIERNPIDPIKSLKKYLSSLGFVFSYKPVDGKHQGKDDPYFVPPSIPQLDNAGYLEFLNWHLLQYRDKCNAIERWIKSIPSLLYYLQDNYYSEILQTEDNDYFVLYHTHIAIAEFCSDATLLCCSLETRDLEYKTQVNLPQWLDDDLVVHGLPHEALDGLTQDSATLAGIATRLNSRGFLLVDSELPALFQTTYYQYQKERDLISCEQLGIAPIPLKEEDSILFKRMNPIGSGFRHYKAKKTKKRPHKYGGGSLPGSTVGLSSIGYTEQSLTSAVRRLTNNQVYRLTFYPGYVKASKIAGNDPLYKDCYTFPFVLTDDGTKTFVCSEGFTEQSLDVFRKIETLLGWTKDEQKRSDMVADRRELVTRQTLNFNRYFESITNPGKTLQKSAVNRLRIKHKANPDKAESKFIDLSNVLTQTAATAQRRKGKGRKKK